MATKPLGINALESWLWETAFAIWCYFDLMLHHLMSGKVRVPLAKGAAA